MSDSLNDDLDQLGTEAEAVVEKGNVKTSTEEVEAIEFSTTDAMVAFYTPILKLAVPTWDLTEVEILTVSKSHAMAIDAFYPDGLFGNSKFVLLLSAIVTTATVAAPHLSKPKVKKESTIPKVVQTGKFYWGP